MSMKKFVVCSIFFLSGCNEKILPQFLDEPLTAEAMLGTWEGSWRVGGTGKSGTATIEMAPDPVHPDKMQWKLLLTGSPLAKSSEPPLEAILTATCLNPPFSMFGKAKKLGDMQLDVDEQGNVSGYIKPEQLGSLSVAGHISPTDFSLDFSILVLPGRAAATHKTSTSVDP
jgi:hypothetical protein